MRRISKKAYFYRNLKFLFMKKLLPLFVLMTCVFSLNAQIISQNFDTVAAGGKVAASLGAPWTTWSSAPGGTEDPVISSAQANSPANSAYIGATTNDLVVNLGDRTTGRYKINFKIFVDTLKVGYFNILNDFAGSNSVWAMQAYFRPTGYVSVDAGGALADSMQYNIKQWNDILFVIDLDDDFATMYVNGTELVSWAFSSGSFGDGSTHKLDGMNFYGWSITGYGPGYYIDDFTFADATAPEAPMNLSAVLTGNDCDLTWTAPGSGSPDGYSVIRNNVPIVNGVTALTYTDLHLYPRDYVYSVKAHYPGEGYSHSSNDTLITVPGGVDRNLVLYEIITGTWCTYCPGAAMGADDMVSHGHDVAVIEYHTGDSYENTDANVHVNYYNTGSVPYTAVDGYYFIAGGDHSVSLYPEYKTLYDYRNPVPAVEKMYLDVTHVSGNDYTATVTVVETNQYFDSNLVLYTALTESNIPESWQGLTDVDFVCRKMYPNGNGTALDFSTNDSLVYTFNFSTTGYVLENCEFVAFVQHTSSKEVVQTSKFGMSYFGVNENAVNNRLEIYPNPAYDYVRIFSDNGGKAEIFNMTGQLVLSEQLVKSEQLINITNLSAGVYTIRVTDGQNISTTKMVVK